MKKVKTPTKHPEGFRKSVWTDATFGAVRKGLRGKVLWHDDGYGQSHAEWVSA